MLATCVTKPNIVDGSIISAYRQKGLTLVNSPCALVAAAIAASVARGRYRLRQSAPGEPTGSFIISSVDFSHCCGRLS